MIPDSYWPQAYWLMRGDTAIEHCGSPQAAERAAEMMNNVEKASN